MTVIAFAPKQLQQDGTWQTSELRRMQARFAAAVASGEASGWEAAATEAVDPQFYLLGPPPDEPAFFASHASAASISSRTAPDRSCSSIAASSG